MTNQTNIFYIIGPTAIGKSDYAIKLALKINAEIISADAYQIYKHMDIGTGKISKEEQKKVPHHLIDSLYPNEFYNVTDFLKHTHTLIKSISSKNKKIIICGGNGLYLRSFLYQYTFPSAKSDPKIRHQLEQDYLNIGKNYLWEKLNTIDPVSAKKIHPNNKHHLLRCLEIHALTDKIPSKIKNQKNQIRQDVKVIGLNADRNVVKENISRRVDTMIDKGLINEVETLLKKGFNPDLPALNCIGYKETISYLKGIINKKDMIELIKRNTNHFSKRQMTWFKKIENINWV